MAQNGSGDGFERDVRDRAENEVVRFNVPPIDAAAIAARARRSRLIRKAGSVSVSVALVAAGVGTVVWLKPAPTLPTVEIVLPTPDQHRLSLQAVEPSPTQSAPSAAPSTTPLEPEGKVIQPPPGEGTPDPEVLPYGGWYGPVLSEDGRFVAFGSTVTAEPASAQAFVFDRSTDKVELVSVDNDGDPVGMSTYVDMTPDGRFVAIPSFNGRMYVRDRVGRRTQLVSVSPSGEPANRDTATPSISISDDGRYVAFISGADNLVPDDTNGRDDIFVRDLVEQRTRRVSVSSSGAQANGGGGAFPKISGDGRYVTFTSTATNLTSETTPECQNCQQVYVHELETGATMLVSKSPLGEPGSATSDYPVISSDGRFVAFVSSAGNLTSQPDLDNAQDVFLHDRQTGSTTALTTAQPQINWTSPTLSEDGRFVSYTSANQDLWVHTVSSGDDRSIGPINGPWASFAQSGKLIAFTSLSGEIVILNLENAARETLG